MPKKLFLLFTLVFVAIIFSECCPKDTPIYMKRRNLHVRQLTLDKAGYNSPYPNTSVPTSVEKSNRYLLHVDFEVDYVVKSEWNPGSLFITQSFASQGCKGYPPGPPRESIESINITSEANFDSIYTSGKSLNELFRPYGITGIPIDSTRSLSTFYNENSFYLELMRKPVKDLVHSFKVEIKLSNGEVFIGNSPHATFEE